MNKVKRITTIALVMLSCEICYAEDTGQGVKQYLKRQSMFMKYVSADQVEQIGEDKYSKVISEAEKSESLVSNSDPKVLRLHSIANRILPLAKEWNERSASWKWQVNLINSEEVNAWCMPGGKIVFYTALLDKLQLTDDEVAFVMGHEITHALREHSRQNLAKAVVTKEGAELLKERFKGGGTSTLLDGAAKLFSLKYSRDYEMEADMVGAELVARAGFDPNASVTFMQKLSSISNQNGVALLSDHPSHQKRINNLIAIQPLVLPLYESSKLQHE